MPTYDYRCNACGHEFEEFQSITAASLRKCPKCRKNTLRRLIGTGAGIIFKGSGFYETDYRSDSYKQAAKADADKSSGKTDAPKSDSATTSSDTAASKPAESKAETPAPAKADPKPAKSEAKPEKSSSKKK